MLYLVALFCSKDSKMTNFLELIFFVLYDEKYEYKVLEAQSILDWIAASKEKIE